MNQKVHIQLKQSTIDDLRAFSNILGKDINLMIEEALEQYTQSEQKKLIENGTKEDISMTNLDYDEFWDGLDIG